MSFNRQYWDLIDWLDGYECSVERCTIPDLDYEGRPIDRDIDACEVFAPVNRWKSPIAYIDSEFNVY